ncbi:hypothetical protein MJ391_23645 [Escherichia coli]|nr:hypothetical protein MJ391_23645 [Escherichia coli]
MEDLNVVDSINGAGKLVGTLTSAPLLSYAVNIVAALAIIIVGLDYCADDFQRGESPIMLPRKIDATVADFLSALVRYAVLSPLR